MARGESKVQQQAGQLGQQQQQQIDLQRAANAGLEGSLAPYLQAMADWGSPALENTYEQRAMQPVASAMDAANERAMNRVSRTGNEAGYGAAQENLAGQRAAQLSQAAQRGEMAYQGEQFQHQLAGLKGLSDLYGIDANLLGHMLGLPTETLGVQQRAAQPTNSMRIGPFGFSW
jgi:hypothetical protein